MGVHFERGQVLFEMGRYREAAKEYLAELAEEPEHVASLINLAASLANCDDNRGAESAAAQAIAADPEHPHAHYILSVVRACAGRYHQAKLSVLESLRLRPKTEYYCQYASILNAVGDREKALQVAREGLALDPQDIAITILHGQLLYELGRVKEARHVFSDALRQAPDQAGAHQGLGATLLLSGKVDLAYESLVEARRLNPLAVNQGMQCAIAEAYGLKLPVFRWLTKITFRPSVWPEHMLWFAAMVITLALVVASNFVEPKAGVPSYWVALCVLFTNYLCLSGTLRIAARMLAFLLLRWKYNLGCGAYLRFPLMVLGIIVAHLLASFLGLILAVVPLAGALASPYIAMRPILRKVNQLSFNADPSLMSGVVLCVIIAAPIVAVHLIAIGFSWIGYVLLALYFLATYFNEAFPKHIGN